MRCPYCGANVPDDADTCETCERALSGTSELNDAPGFVTHVLTLAIVGGLTLLVVLALGLLVWLLI